MCGRVRLSSDVSEIRLVFRIPPDRPLPNFPPSWNAAPTDSLPVVRFDAKAGQRSLPIQLRIWADLTRPSRGRGRQLRLGLLLCLSAEALAAIIVAAPVVFGGRHQGRLSGRFDGGYDRASLRAPCRRSRQ